MDKPKLIEPTGFIVASVIGLICLVMFYNDSSMFLDSVYAAFMTAALTWLSYVVIRLVVLAFK